MKQRRGFRNPSISREELESKFENATDLKSIDYRYPHFLGAWERATPQNSTNFAFDDMDEPHIKRKHTILSKYPEIKELFGYEPSTKYIAAAIVAIQWGLALTFGLYFTPTYFAHEFQGWPSWIYWAVFGTTAYVVGGFLSAIVGVIIHEISHSLCFETHFANRMLGLFVNLSLPVPIAMSFRRYHLDHHAYQGVKSKDPDLPLDWEVRLIRHNWLTKMLWVMIYPVMYCVRGLSFQKVPNRWEIINTCTTIAADVALCYLGGARAFLYLFLSLYFGYSLHPGAAHFIQEHYTFLSGQETYSYYGILNVPMLNIGLHNEHHDFTKIPWSRLPQLNNIANEFYACLHAHTSWVYVLFAFIFDKQVAALSRCARDVQTHSKGRRLVPKLMHEYERLAGLQRTTNFKKTVTKVDSKLGFDDADPSLAHEAHYHPTADLWINEKDPLESKSWEGEEEMELVEQAIINIVNQERQTLKKVK